MATAAPLVEARRSFRQKAYRVSEKLSSKVLTRFHSENSKTVILSKVSFSQNRSNSCLIFNFFIPDIDAFFSFFKTAHRTSGQFPVSAKDTLRSVPSSDLDPSF